MTGFSPSARARAPTLYDARPVFVLSTARSGSTLLRLALNAHPAIACPGGTNLATAFAAIQFAVSATGYDGSTGTRRADDLCRDLAESTIGAYARAHGKERWCDKSLASVDQAELLRRVYPEALFICLCRHPRDTMASLLEASPFGFGNFGIEPYARAYPTNLVLAVATYWCDKIDAMLEFERENKERCVRLRYEDMVSRPQAALAELFAFLELEWDIAFVDDSRIFGQDLGDTRGDHKLRFTSTFLTTSIGRGWTLPIDLIPPDVLDRMNHLNDQLGYERVEEAIALPQQNGASAMSAAESSVVRRAGAASGSHDETAWGAVLALLRANIQKFEAVEGYKPIPTTLFVVDVGETWMIDFGSRELSEKGRAGSCMIVSDSPTLTAIMNGTCNPGDALRRGLVRFAPSQHTERYFRSPERAVQQLDAFWTLLLPAHPRRSAAWSHDDDALRDTSSHAPQARATANF